MKLTPKEKLAGIGAGAIQLWAPYALEMAISGKEPPLTHGQRKVLGERRALTHLVSAQGSWNHQQMLWALSLWLDGDPSEAAEWWEYYLKYQLGDFEFRVDARLRSGSPALLLYWGGSESNSAGYEHMRWGCVCAVDLWARKLKMGNGDLLPLLCRRYHRTQIAMCRLLPTAVGERSGEHRNPLHLEMWKLAEGRQPKRKWPREIDWPMRLAAQVLGGYLPPDRPEDVARPLFSEIRCAQWADGTRVFWLVERKNLNTPPYLIQVDYGATSSLPRPNEGSRLLVYPWQRGRGFNDKRAGGVVAQHGNVLLWRAGEESGFVSLPEGLPSRCYAIGPQGYVEGDWPAWLRGE